MEPAESNRAPTTGQTSSEIHECEAGNSILPERATLRKRIETLCRTDDELDSVLGDYFPKVHQKLSRGMTRTEKINELLARTETADIAKVLTQVEFASQSIPRLVIDNVRKPRPKTSKKWKHRKKVFVGILAIDGLLNYVVVFLSWLAEKVGASRYDRQPVPVPLPALAVAVLLSVSIAIALVQRYVHPTSNTLPYAHGTAPERSALPAPTPLETTSTPNGLHR